MATAARGPASGQTQMQSQAPETQTTTQAVLHLRGAERGSENIQGGETRRRIQWAEDVVDNEGMGKKKSKGLSSLFPIYYPSHTSVWTLWKRKG
jgi:protein phosphatase 1 regulatory subunit 11